MSIIKFDGKKTNHKQRHSNNRHKQILYLKNRLKEITCPEDKPKVFEKTILGIILLEAFILILETLDPSYFFPISEFFGMESPKIFFDQIHYAILSIFIIEMCIKIFAFDKKYFKFVEKPEISSGNLFDFSVVVISVLVLILTHDAVLSAPILLVRFVRLFRMLRIVTVSSHFEQIVSTLFRAAPTFIYIGLLLGLLFFVYALTGHLLFADEVNGDWNSLLSSSHTLFQLITLENWQDLESHLMATELMKSELLHGFPLPFFFVGSFIIIGNFIILSMIISTLTKKSEDEAGKDPDLKLIELARGHNKIDFRSWQNIPVSYSDKYYPKEFTKITPNELRQTLEKTAYLNELVVLRSADLVSKEFESLDDDKKNVIWRLVKKERKYHSFSLIFGFMIATRLKKIQNQDVRKEILEQAIHHKIFARGFCDEVGRNFDKIPPLIQGEVLGYANKSTPFRALFLNSLGRNKSEYEQSLN